MPVSLQVYLSTCFYHDSEHMKRRLYEKEINKMIRNGLFSLLCLHFQICDCHIIWLICWVSHLWPKDIKLMHQGQLLTPTHKSGRIVLWIVLEVLKGCQNIFGQIFSATFESASEVTGTFTEIPVMIRWKFHAVD